MSRDEVVEATRVAIPRRALVVVAVVGALVGAPSPAPAAAAAVFRARTPLAAPAGAPSSDWASDQAGAPGEGDDLAVTTAPDGVTRLAPARADEQGRRSAAAAVREAERGAALARRRLASLQRQVPTLDQAVQDAGARLEMVRQRELAAAAVLDEARGRLRGLAVASYMTGGSTPKLAYLLQSGDGADLGRRSALVGSATQVQRETVASYDQARAAATNEAVDASVALQELVARRASVAEQLRTTETDLADREAEVNQRRLLLDLVTAAAPALPTDIPRLVLDAYQRAILTMAVRMPACRVPWPAVAALGRIESNHGRYRGARFALNGDVYPIIIGIPLDGTNSTRVIKDTDGGRYDGDAEYDRAVGPMQFIPSTWARVGLDGNGDDVADPNNIYDATLSAASYLCRAVPSGGIDVEENLARAYFSYNRSQAYVDAGLALYRRYGEQAGQIKG